MQMSELQLGRLERQVQQSNKRPPLSAPFHPLYDVVLGWPHALQATPCTPRTPSMPQHHLPHT